MTSIYENRYKSIATWLPKDDYEKLKSLARINKVSISTYLRAMVTDVLFEEGELLNGVLATSLSHALQNGGSRTDVIDTLQAPNIHP